jgi:hypothetical protein
MDRRGFFKLAPVALAPQMITNGKLVAAAVATAPMRYILFVDPQAVNIDALVDSSDPGVEVIVVPVKLREDQTMDEAVRLYEVQSHAGS